jgi:hypothetical protein
VSALADPTLATDALIECRRHGTKPLLAYVSPHAPHIVETLNRNGVPAFAGPEGCAAAPAAMQLRAPAAGPAENSGSAAPDGLWSGPLDELESKQLFARFGTARQDVRLPPHNNEVVMAGYKPDMRVRIPFNYRRGPPIAGRVGNRHNPGVGNRNNPGVGKPDGSRKLG